MGTLGVSSGPPPPAAPSRPDLPHERRIRGSGARCSNGRSRAARAARGSPSRRGLSRRPARTVATKPCSREREKKWDPPSRSSHSPHPERRLPARDPEVPASPTWSGGDFRWTRAEGERTWLGRKLPSVVAPHSNSDI